VEKVFRLGMVMSCAHINGMNCESKGMRIDTRGGLTWSQNAVINIPGFL